MDERLLGEGGRGSKTLLFSLAGELGSLPCQKRRGEAVENGDEPAGDDSALVNSFPWGCLCQLFVRMGGLGEMQTTHLRLRKTRGISTKSHRAQLRQWTVGYSGQLGRRRAIAALLNA